MPPAPELSDFCKTHRCPNLHYVALSVFLLLVISGCLLNEAKAKAAAEAKAKAEAEAKAKAEAEAKAKAAAEAKAKIGRAHV